MRLLLAVRQQIACGIKRPCSGSKRTTLSSAGASFTPAGYERVQQSALFATRRMRELFNFVAHVAQAADDAIVISGEYFGLLLRDLYGLCLLRALIAIS